MNITKLSRGKHDADSGEMCLMEAVAFVAGEPWSDHPACVSPVLGSFGRTINDRMPNDATRALLIPPIPRLLNTAGDGKDERRMFMCADWACRVVMPRVLEAVGLHEQAETLRSLAPVANVETARIAAAANVAAYSGALSWPEVVEFFDRLITAEETA